MNVIYNFFFLCQQTLKILYKQYPVALLLTHILFFFGPVNAARPLLAVRTIDSFTPYFFFRSIIS
jgi:hypothetical protein